MERNYDATKKRKRDDNDSQERPVHTVTSRDSISVSADHHRQQAATQLKLTLTVEERTEHVSCTCCSSSNKFTDLEEESDEVEVETTLCSSNRERKQLSNMELSKPELASPTTSIGLPDSATSSPPPPPEGKKVKQIKVSGSDLDNYFDRAEKKHLKEAMEKYNFDFINEKPLKGRYEWVRVESNGAAIEENSKS